MLEDDGITAAIEELQGRLGDLQNSIDQALQVPTLFFFIRDVVTLGLVLSLKFLQILTSSVPYLSLIFFQN